VVTDTIMVKKIAVTTTTKTVGNNKKRFHRGGVDDSSRYDSTTPTTPATMTGKARRRRLRQTSNVPVEKLEERERRSALLTRDSKEKRDGGKLRLHIRLVQRRLEKLKDRLEVWDEAEERRLADLDRMEEERKQREELDGGPPTKKKRGRLGPETWKLKGAARPAWQVYDFDTRYVDPNVKAHEAAKEKMARCRNVLILCKGRFGSEDDSSVPQPQCREYLSLLMQLGNLSMQAKQLKAARKAFLDCMELDSAERPITPARCQLMRLCMEANKPESARRLWERLPPNDPAVWIRYSAALVEFVSWRILQEEGSTRESAEGLLASAIRTNIFCAFYLAFCETFDGVMDYTDEIEDADDDSPLEQAIEYCNSEQMGSWKGTDGALEWVKSALLRVINGGSLDGTKLTSDELDWRRPLAAIRQAHSRATQGDDPHFSSAEAEVDNCNDATIKNVEDDDEDEVDSVVDVAMFAGMFETAMEMLEASGSLK
jgi:hypothetical protein